MATEGAQQVVMEIRMLTQIYLVHHLEEQGAHKQQGVPQGRYTQLLETIGKVLLASSVLVV